MRRSLLALAALIAAFPALAAPKDDEKRYSDCMQQVGNAPEKAWKTATRWEAKGGGYFARHCGAMALMKQGKNPEAAERLEALAGEARELDLKADLLAQAGAAWVLHGKLDKAVVFQGRAIELQPDDVELRLDRATVRADLGDLKGAVEDLDHAIRIDSQNAEALLLRATAHRRLNNLTAARADIDAAVVLAPGDPEILLERGVIRRLGGDDAGARADWTGAAADPDTPAGKAARHYLDQREK